MGPPAGPPGVRRPVTPTKGDLESGYLQSVSPSRATSFRLSDPGALMGLRETHDGDVVQERPAEVPQSQALGDNCNMKVTFKDLSYVVRNNGSNKAEKTVTLLDKVSGFLLPQHLTALMGPSGSGKTTLLDVLAWRKTTGKTHGIRRYAGQPATKPFLRRFTGYVEQDDALIGNLTVFEMLLYTAELKLPRRTPYKEKCRKVQEVLERLSLVSCQDTCIGSRLQTGISGGQSKRTNIGIALVSNPRVLFLDEPTSGLDSYTANEVMGRVKELARSGMTVCATIHSPTPFTFNLFDTLMILLHGRVVYFGENGPIAINYFERNVKGVEPFSLKGIFHNKAEWIVDLTTRADRDGKHAELAEAYARSDLCTRMQTALTQHLDDNATVPAELRKELDTKSETANPFWWGVHILLKYRMGTDIKDLSFLGPRIGDKTVLALIIMTLYWRVGANQAPSNVNNITAVLFLWTILPGYSAASYMPSIVLERPLYVRERSDGLYRPITYLVAKMVEELTIFFLLSLVLTAIVFCPCQLAGDYLLFWFVNLVTTSCGIALGYLIAAVSPNMEVANAALPAYVTVLLFFVGLLLRPQEQPGYWRWFAYLDFLKYAWQAQMINQFEGSKAVALDFMSVLKFYDLEGKNKWEQLVYEVLFLVAFMVLAWVGLAYKRHLLR